VPRTLRPGAEDHQAEVGVAWLGEAVGHLGYAGETLVEEQTEAVAIARVAVGRRVGEEVLRLGGGVAAAFGEEPVVGGLAVELRDEGGFRGEKLTDAHG
jgi:hypothetical protein